MFIQFNRKLFKFWIRQLFKTICWVITVPIAILSFIAFIISIIAIYLVNEKTILDTISDEWPIFWDSISMMLFARKPK